MEASSSASTSQREPHFYTESVVTGSDINCISLRTFQGFFPNKQLNRSTLLLENYGNSPVSITGRFTAFIRWKGKVFHQEFHVTNANFSPNLLSRDACFRMEVLQTSFAVTGKEIHLPQPEPVINKTTLISKAEEMFHSTKPHWKMEEPYKLKLKENHMPARMHPGKFLSIYKMAFLKK